MADPTTPFLGLTKPIVNDEAGEDLWGEKLNGNFDKLDASAADIVDDITLLQTTVVTDSPHDGHPYGRKDGAWFDVSTLPVSWTSVTGKPATFPPELPIPQTGVTGLIADQATQNSAITANTTAISTKEPAIAPGTVNDFWRGDKTWVPLSTITVDAYTKAQADARFAPIVHTHAIADVTGLTAALAAKEPTIATGNPTYFWRGDKTWQPVPAAGIADAPSDGVTYGRKNAAWTAVSGPVTVGLTAPVSPRPGDLWYKSDVCLLYVYYDDGNTAQWVVTIPQQSIDGLDARYVKKAGDQMTGALRVYAPALSPAPQPDVSLAGTLVAGANIGMNLYPDAGANWPRMIAGYGGIFQCDPANGTFNWYAGTTGAAGAAAGLTTPMTLTKDGALSVTGPVTSSESFIGAVADVILANRSGAGQVILRPNGPGSATGQAYLSSSGTFVAPNVSSPGSIICQPASTYSAFMAMNAAATAYITMGLDGGGGGVLNHSSPSPYISMQLSGTEKGRFVSTGLYMPASGSSNYTIDARVNAPYGSVIGFSPGAVAYGICGYNGGYSFYGAGPAYLSSGTWGTSDGAFKDIAEAGPFEETGMSAIGVVEDIPVRAFAWKGPMAELSPNGVEQFGFIAAEVERVLPIAVMDIIAAPHDEKLRTFLNPKAKAGEDVTFKGLNHDYLVATLWRAVQELSARVKQLEGAP